MPETLFRRVERLREQERHYSTAELFDMWLGRRTAAVAWLVACDMQLRDLLQKRPPDYDGVAEVKIIYQACGWESYLKVDRVLEPPAPSAAGPLPDPT